MYRPIKCRCFKGKLIQKFVLFCCFLSLVIAIAVFSRSVDDIGSKIAKLNEKFSGKRFKIIETIEDEIYAFKPPKNIFGTNVSVGEFGEAVILPENISAECKALIDKGLKDHSFNQYVSDIMSINRTLKDERTEYCKAMDGTFKNLPKTSVIITFHNEAWSTLMRTIHSIINRSPAELLEEIILVDDFSSMVHLKQRLDHFVKKVPKIKIIRCMERSGLIKARIKGALAAKGPVLTFLDSHIECAKGWLEPLLARIAENSKNVAVPVIDIINDKTFAYEWLSEVPAGGFDWYLNFNWIMDMKPSENSSLPIKSPTMAGGLFSIDKEFFTKLGMYDSGFDIWGGENLELSFKTWMCGGNLEIIPCSHVGHIFREKSPYTWTPGVNVLKKNLIRMSRVWMDEYAQFFYMRMTINENDFADDVSDRKLLRTNLKCHDFDWYLKNVYPSQINPLNAIGQGKISNKISKTCIEIDSSEVKLHECRKNRNSQFLMMSEDGRIRRNEYCLYYSKRKVKSDYCTTHLTTNEWSYFKFSSQIYHNESGMCLTVSKQKVLVLKDCDSSQQQKWRFEFVNYVHY